MIPSRPRPPHRTGFTLVELSVGISVGMAICVTVLLMLNQQIAFIRVYRAQNFLTEEAPIINMYVSRLVGQAERYRLHDNLADALTGANPRSSESPVLVLNFPQPDGSMRASILAYQDLGSGPALYYYVVPASGVLGTPQWAVTRKPSAVRFSVWQGVLRVTLDGPNGERITYSGSLH